MFSLPHNLICHIRWGWLICRLSLCMVYDVRKEIKENFIPSWLNKPRRYLLRLLSAVRASGSQKRDAKTRSVNRQVVGTAPSSLSICLRDTYNRPQFDEQINRVLSTRQLSLKAWLMQQGIKFVSDPDRADIIVTDHSLPEKLLPNTKTYSLSIDPKLSCATETWLSVGGGPSALVSNCYTNTLLTSNYACLPYPFGSQPYPHNTAHYPCRQSLSFPDIKHKWHHKKKVLFINNRRNLRYKFPPRNILTLREHFALYGVVKGIADMASGRYYLPHIVIPEKEIIHDYLWGLYAGESYIARLFNKIEWLRRDYLFCIAFENSLIPYYVSEKLWTALWGYTLPIYYSNDTVYETFPKDCIIDYRDFNSKDDLYEYIMTMPAEEYLERLNIGLAFVNNTAEHTRRHNEWCETAREHIYNDLIRLAQA